MASPQAADNSTSDEPYDIHTGNVEDIPPEATPGLLFLKKWLPMYDFTGPFSDGPKTLLNMMYKTTEFYHDSGEITTAADEMLWLWSRSLNNLKLDRLVQLVYDRRAGFPGARRVLLHSILTIRDATDTSVIFDKLTDVLVFDLRPAESGSSDLRLVKMRQHTMDADASEKEQGLPGLSLMLGD